MRGLWVSGLAIATVMGLGGCTDPESSWLVGHNRVNSAAAVQIVGAETEPFSSDRLARMIEEAVPRVNLDVDPHGGTDSLSNDPTVRLDRALARFAQVAHHQHSSASRTRVQNQLRDARNSIQDQLIAASTNRCNVYKVYLRRVGSATQFGLGSAATLAGAAGALVTGGASQVLSAAAGGISGVNAEFQKDYFGSLMTSVIIPGIDRQRADLRNDIVSKSCFGVSDYPLSLALGEVIRFHGACSADVGIAASGQAVARTSPDSISAALATMEQVRKLTTVLRTPNQDELRNAKARVESVTNTVATLTKKLADEPDTEQKKLIQAKLNLAKQRLMNAENNLKTKTAAATDGAQAAAETASLFGNYEDNRPNNLLGTNLTITPCKPLDQDGK